MQMPNDYNNKPTNVHQFTEVPAPLGDKTENAAAWTGAPKACPTCHKETTFVDDKCSLCRAPLYSRCDCGKTPQGALQSFIDSRVLAYGTAGEPDA